MPRKNLASISQLVPAALRGRQRLRMSLRRVRRSAAPILQCSLAAGVAWWIAHDLAQHQRPFFAPIAAVVSLGVSFGARLRRSVELVVGVAVGVGVGDLFISAVGTGVWQIVLVVGLAMATAVLLDGGPVIATQAAGSAVLVATLIPPGDRGGFDRMVDALIGGLVGVAVVAVVPTHPLRRARREAAELLGVASWVLARCADGLLAQDPQSIVAALRRIRATQPQLDALRASLKGGREVSVISPLYWSSRSRLERLSAMADPLDNAIRNIRVLVRRALTLVRDDEILDPRLVDEVEKLSQATDVLRRMIMADPGQMPDEAEATRVLREVAYGADPEIMRDAGLSAHVVFAQIRSTVVDLMQVAGMQRASAMALLPPTVPHPAIPPAEQA